MGLSTPETIYPAQPKREHIVMDVYVTETKLYGPKPWLYQVWVDGTVYDAFQSTRPLTWSEQWDVAGYYREALDAPALAG
jgi:hypothetical protein